jgi:hypothetical protein
MTFSFGLRPKSQCSEVAVEKVVKIGERVASMTTRTEGYLAALALP